MDDSIFKGVILPVLMVIVLLIFVVNLTNPPPASEAQLDHIRQSHQDILDITQELKLVAALTQQFLDEEMAEESKMIEEPPVVWSDLMHRTQLGEDGEYLDDESDLLIIPGNYNRWI